MYDFPASPTENQEFVPPTGGQTYIYKAPRWLVKGIPPTGGGGGGGIGEAPEDGQQYARQDADWTVVEPGVSDWVDITGKPTTFPPELPIPWTDVSGKPATFPPDPHSHAFTDITDKPSTYPPDPHSHAFADITGKPATYPPTLPIAWGDVSGKPSTFPPSTHSHPQSEVTNLVTDLADKAPLVHTHPQSDISNLTTDLAAKLNASAYTAADVLSKILTVDGPGSGLDADTLDGINSSNFVQESAADSRFFVRRNGTWLDMLQYQNPSQVRLYMWRTETAAPPTSTQVRANNASVAASTELYFHKTDLASQDASLVFTVMVKTGMRLVIQDHDEMDKWYSFVVTGAVVDSGTYYTVPVLHNGSSGAGMANGSRATLYIIAPEKAVVQVNDNPPNLPANGQLWWESDTGNLYVWYNDGTSSQWVSAVGGGTPSPAADPVEVVTSAPASNQNNLYVTAQVTKRTHTILDISPTVSMVLSGIDTTSWEAGKCITVRNATTRLGADARMIIMPRASALSTAANRFQYPGNARLPLILLPEESAEFYFNGTDLKLLRSSRPLNLEGYFDYRLNGTWSGGAWTNGAGAGSTYQGGDVGVIAGEPYIYLNAQTGTTAAGRSAFVDQSVSTRFGLGAVLCLSRVMVPQLSTAAEEFQVRVGFTETAAITTDEACWTYNRAGGYGGGNWFSNTANNGTPTNGPLGPAVSITEAPWLGVFVNGDGTRADFFYSIDGITWTFHSTHTSNIPNTSGRLMGFGTSLVKLVGTTAVNFRTLFTGQIGWM